MNWYERRALVLKMAETEPGWGCVRLAFERHVGRVCMFRVLSMPAGLYAAGTPAYVALNHYLRAKQRKADRALPK